jgi:hypothetical protein
MCTLSSILLSLSLHYLIQVSAEFYFEQWVEGALHHTRLDAGTRGISCPNMKMMEGVKGGIINKFDDDGWNGERDHDYVWMNGSSSFMSFSTYPSLNTSTLSHTFQDSSSSINRGKTSFSSSPALDYELTLGSTGSTGNTQGRSSKFGDQPWGVSGSQFGVQLLSQEQVKDRSRGRGRSRSRSRVRSRGRGRGRGR